MHYIIGIINKFNPGLVSFKKYINNLIVIKWWLKPEFPCRFPITPARCAKNGIQSMSSVQLVLIVWMVVLGFKGTLCAMTDHCTDECSGMDGIKGRAGQGYAWAKNAYASRVGQICLNFEYSPPLHDIARA